jgi:creatinine amidohydrolase
MAVFTDTLSSEVRLEQMRPRQIERAIALRPAIYVPFGSIEWHGRQNAVGLDAIKAHEQLVGLARKAGGVVYPPVFFGCGGGHGDFPYSYMVEHEHLLQITATLLAGFERDGFQAAILLAGHYPNKVGPTGFLGRAAEKHAAAGGAIKVLHLTEAQAPKVPGDHAAKWETSFMMYLHPDLVDLGELAGRDDDIGGPADRFSWMKDEDRDHPCYGICGIDPRTHASREAGEKATTTLIDYLASWLDENGVPRGKA